MQLTACTGFSIAISTEGMTIAATEIGFFFDHWLTSAEAAGCPFHSQERTSSYHRGMSVLCQ
jgi:hypothetical protein